MVDYLYCTMIGNLVSFIIDDSNHAIYFFRLDNLFISTNKYIRMNKSVGLILASALPWICLVFLITYTYVFFFQVPYAGFRFSGSNSRIYTLYSVESSSN